MPEHSQSAQVAALNDQFRQSFDGGQIFITQGIQALPTSTVFKIMDAIRAFDDFSEANDPYSEHDFGAVKVAGHCIFWKIDAYDSDMLHATPDPTDPTVTTRVMTIMLDHEY